MRKLVRFSSINLYKDLPNLNHILAQFLKHKIYFSKISCVLMMNTKFRNFLFTKSYNILDLEKMPIN